FRCAPSRWLFCRFFTALFRMGFPTTKHYLRDLTGERFAEIQNDPAARQFAESVYESLSDFRHERAGYRNDLATWLREDVMASHLVSCPTMLLYDRCYPAAPFCHAEYALAEIPSAELVELHAGGHLIWYGHDVQLMQERRTAFLKEHLGAGLN